MMQPGTKARVMYVDPYGWLGRVPHPTREDVGKVVEVLEGFTEADLLPPGDPGADIVLYRCAVLDFTRREMTFVEHELRET